MEKYRRLDTITQTFYELDGLTELYTQIPEVALEWIKKEELPFTEEDLIANIPNIEIVENNTDVMKEYFNKKR